MDGSTASPDTASGSNAGLTRFNAWSEQDARTTLLACCAAPSWVEGMLAGRPYADRSILEQTANSLVVQLDWQGVEAALAAHPRIGERASGGAQGATESWSRAEQSGVSRDGQTLIALAEGNRGYEQRFGHVFLICATGLSGEQVLASLTERLGRDPEQEQLVVREELRKIALLRLDKALDVADGEGAAR